MYRMASVIHQFDVPSRHAMRYLLTRGLIRGPGRPKHEFYSALRSLRKAYLRICEGRRLKEILSLVAPSAGMPECGEVRASGMLA